MKEITYPGMAMVDGLLWNHGVASAVAAAGLATALGGRVIFSEQTTTGPSFAEWKRGQRLVRRNLDVDVAWVAPWWIAWFYRLLPSSVAWRPGPEYDTRLAPFFSWVVNAPTWRLAWMPIRRSPGGRWGTLFLGDKRVPI